MYVRAVRACACVCVCMSVRACALVSLSVRACVRLCVGVGVRAVHVSGVSMCGVAARGEYAFASHFLVV